MMSISRYNPGAPEVESDYRPVPFWSWNDKLEKDELIRQIHEMHDAGIGGFFMHARGGLKTPYMGKEWMAAVSVCVREAVKLSMKPWLYDENGWPSGFAAGEVNALGELYQSKHAELLPVSKIGNASKILAWYDNDGKRVEEQSCAAFALGVFVNPFYVDNLNPEVVAEFIKHVHERYWAELPADVRQGLTGIFTDEPQLSTRGIPWSPSLTDTFRKHSGKELLEVFPELCMEIGSWRQTRIDFWQTVAILFRDSYICQIGQWCKAHDWKLTGHHLMEESYDSQLNTNGAVMPQYEGFSIPGIDHLYRVSAFTTPEIQVASAAAQNGQKQILVETFACAGWNFNLKGIKWLYQQHLVNGINLLCQHLEGYSLHGQRKRDYPASVFYQHPMWHHIRGVFDCFARVGRMLAQGTPECEVLLIHGESSAWMRSHGHFQDRFSKNLFQSFCQLSHTLCAAGIPFHYGDEIMLSERGSVAEKKLRLGAMSYSCVVIPPVENLLKSTMDLLQAFVRQGGKIVRLDSKDCCGFYVNGMPPSPAEQEFYEQIPVCKNHQEILDFLRGTPSLQIRNLGGVQGRVRGTWRRFPETKERWYYIADCAYLPENKIPDEDFGTELYVNTPEPESGSLVEITLPFPAEKAEIIAQETGVVEAEIPLYTRPDGKCTFLCQLPAIGSLLIRAEDRAEVQPELDLTPHWSCRTSDNVMTLEKVSYRCGTEEKWQSTDTLSLFNRLLGMNQDVPVEIRYGFEILPELDLAKADLKIAVEPDAEAVYLLNGTEIPNQFLPGFFLDRSIRVLRLPVAQLRHGENFFTVKTCFRQSAEIRASVERAKHFESEANKLFFDSEVEAAYLLGQFGCYCKGGVKQEREGAFFLNEPFVLGAMPETVDSGHSLMQGFPFFTGTLVLEKEIELTSAEAAQFRKLCWTHVKANAVQFTVNGSKFPMIFAPPYEIDLEGVLKAGKNHLEMRIETSCRNTLGPFHTKDTEPLSVSPGIFLTEPDLLGWYRPVNVPEYGLLEPTPGKIMLLQ